MKCQNIGCSYDTNSNTPCRCKHFLCGNINIMINGVGKIYLTCITVCACAIAHVNIFKVPQSMILFTFIRLVKIFAFPAGAKNMCSYVPIIIIFLKKNLV